MDDPRMVWALERTLYLVGEAARSLDDATRAAIDQPWPDIIGLRTVLAHRYAMVSPQRLRDIAQAGLPPLLEAVQIHLARQAER